MKLTTVISSVNNNSDYYNFLPYQILFWNKFNIKFICIFIGEKIPNELEQYNPELLYKDKILAITKSDMLDDELKAEIRLDLPEIPSVFISSIANQGIDELKDLIWKELNA